MVASNDMNEWATALNPWEQQAGEPDVWYRRFKLYLALGPMRTYREAYCRATQGRSGKVGRTTPVNWFQQPNRWCWRERAQAWDAQQRNLLALSERNLRVALRHRRVEVMEDTLESIRGTLDTADIASADQEQARAWLPQLRVFLRDMLVAERQEFERAAYEQDDPDNGVKITADDLRAAQRELERQGPLRVGQEPAAPTAREGGGPLYGPGSKPGPVLAVCLGDDPQLQLELGPLRAVRAASGLRFTRILNATRAKFVQHLRREQGFGRPVELLHLGLHASAAGIEFVDGPANSDWLRRRLRGVRVLLLASYAGDGVGDWLGVVPYAVSLRKEAAGEDLAPLAQQFWQRIGAGEEPGAALEGALAQCPPALGAYVVRHW